MKKIGVLLSGCGVMDGSEIHEAVLTLLAIDKEEMEAVCIAPDSDQAQVMNHLINKPMNEKRNMLVEAARIARGKIKDLKDIKANDIDAIIMPGGFGAACNLSTFASKGKDSKVLPEVENLLRELHRNKKPIGAICIAPNIIANVFGKEKVELTIGTDPNTANILGAMGAKHINKRVDEIVIDEKNNVVTTPAYMLGKSPKEIEAGITKLVKAIAKMVQKEKIAI